MECIECPLSAVDSIVDPQVACSENLNHSSRTTISPAWHRDGKAGMQHPVTEGDQTKPRRLTHLYPCSAGGRTRVATAGRTEFIASVKPAVAAAIASAPTGFEQTIRHAAGALYFISVRI